MFTLFISWLTDLELYTMFHVNYSLAYRASCPKTSKVTHEVCLSWYCFSTQLATCSHLQLSWSEAAEKSRFLSGKQQTWGTGGSWRWVNMWVWLTAPQERKILQLGLFSPSLQFVSYQCSVSCLLSLSCRISWEDLSLQTGFICKSISSYASNHSK